MARDQMGVDLPDFSCLEVRVVHIAKRNFEANADRLITVRISLFFVKDLFDGI